ncbi:GNAT family N-acetyltransferase [Polaribacter undariae]|uniref:GNAT family N-acetyltransferase n=1 Tax=Polaribacter sejongensis TaxID=985043 RepID=A0AAJ1QVE8_9FLAO|nr:GNAT family N-acetyltransferase [Polaribacter undariae]MDN3618782.1 GNAT family N-acetyltransferase [Polaribacter undariae]UWD32873.1 GNAT family N-acetyltransferase [Polaribacter undariae]
MIFETERLIIRRLCVEDIDAFHKLESNVNVLKYATGNPKSYIENETELKTLILKYNTSKNGFWIYAIVRKTDNQFLGTVALVKDNLDDEIGYRFLEEFWKLGYGAEVCVGLITYCKKLKMDKIIGYVVDENIASSKILENNNFKIKNTFINDEGLAETKYELYL